MDKLPIHKMSEVEEWNIYRASDIVKKKQETISEKIDTMRVAARQIRDSIEPGSSRGNSERRKLAGRIESICFDIYGSIKKLEETEKEYNGW